ncbi:hypothetical protein MRX96_016650 [Rhipicephalus microplus]
MPVVGKLDPFDPSTSEWTEYRERAELYFIANDIPSDKQTAVFLTCCGPETYSLLRGLLAPSRPAQAGLTEIFTTLGKHYAPRVSEVVASFKFSQDIKKRGRPYDLKYWPGSQIAHADGSSRLPLPTAEFVVDCPAEVLMLEGVSPGVLSSNAVAAATSRDPVLSQVRAALWSGCQINLGSEGRPYETPLS